MPTGIGYKVDPITGERVPYEYVYPTASPQQSPMGGQGLNLNMGALNGVDAEQASEAITAAIKYQGSRGYMQDIQNGVKPDMALSKWAPLMFYSRASTGAGSLVNALTPKPMPNYQFVPGANGAPATYQAQGFRPVVVPQSAIPQTPVAPPEPIVKELAPGVRGAWMPGKGGLHLLPNKSEMNAERRSIVLQRLANIQEKLPNISPNSPAYSQLTNELDSISQELKKNGPLEVTATQTQAPPAGKQESLKPSGKKVRVKSPNGQWGFIPEEQLNAALNQGYTK